jgi:hypothetical protein
MDAEEDNEGGSGVLGPTGLAGAAQVFSLVLITRAALCNDVGVDADTDVVVLVFAHKCEARRMGYFSFDEFNKGMKALE